MVYLLLVIGLNSAGLSEDMILPLNPIHFIGVKEIEIETGKAKVQKNKHTYELSTVIEAVIDANGNEVLKRHWVWSMNQHKDFGDIVEIDCNDYECYTIEGVKLDTKETFLKIVKVNCFAVLQPSDIEKNDPLLKKVGRVKVNPSASKQMEETLVTYFIVPKK